MDRRRAAWALLALAACIAGAKAAPTTSNQTALDLYEEHTEGCYYNFQHYGEGDRIMTNEPCLNCTCHNRMLMCYLRVCPFTKAIGQDCTVEKRADQCCPIVTCPDVPVDLLTSTSTTSPAEYGGTGVGKVDNYGCSINGRYFPEGAKVPQTPGKPCEHCYCIRNMTTCVMQECTLHVDGCTPIYHKDVCCPVRYFCDHPDEEMLLLDDMTTTVRPTPGFLLTTTSTEEPSTQTEPAKRECVENDQLYPDGALIKTEKPCVHCYCMKGDIVCVVQECGTPMENEGKNCTSMPPRDGQCCPDTYICEGDESTTEVATEGPHDEFSTIVPPRRSGVEGSGYRNEPDYTELPTFATEIEGSGEDQEQYKPIEPSTTEKAQEGELGNKFGEESTEGSAKPTEASISETEEVTTEPDRGLNTVPSSDDEAPLDQEKTTPRSEVIATEPSLHEQDLPVTSQVEEESTEPSALTTAEVEPTQHSLDSEQTTKSSVGPVEESPEPSVTESTESKYTELTTVDETTTPVEKYDEESVPAVQTTVSAEESKTTEPSLDTKQTTSVTIEEESHVPETMTPIVLTTPLNTDTPKYEEEYQSTPSKSANTTSSSSMPPAESTEGTTPSKQEEETEPSEFVTTPKIIEETSEMSGLNTIPSDIAEEETLKPSGIDETTIKPEAKITEPPFIMEQETETSKITEGSSQYPTDDKLTTSYEIERTELPKSTESVHTYEAVSTESSFEKETVRPMTEALPEEETSAFIGEISKETATTPGYEMSQDTAKPVEESQTTAQLPEHTVSVTSKEPMTDSFMEPSTSSPLAETSAPSMDKIDEPQTTTINTDENEIIEDVTQIPGRIPGEGDCLLNGITYKNESVITSTNKCYSGCKCISSIVKCDPILCSPPPEYMDNCQLTYDTPDSCCPTYVCDHTMETVPPKPHSQMSGTESPISTQSFDCNGDQCEGEEKEPVTVRVETSQPPGIDDCGPDGCLSSKEPTTIKPSITSLPEIIPEVCEDPTMCKKISVPESVQPCEGESCITKMPTEPSEPSVPCEGEQCETQTESTVPKTEPSIPCEGDQCETKTEPTIPKVESIVPCEGEQCETQTKSTVPKTEPSVSCEGEQCDTKTEPTITKVEPIFPCEGEQCETQTGSTVPKTEPSIQCEGEQCETKTEPTIPKVEPIIPCEGEQCETQTESTVPKTETSVSCAGEQCDTKTEPSITKEEPTVLCESEQCETKTETTVLCEGEQCETKTEPTAHEIKPSVPCEGEQCETQTESAIPTTVPSVSCEGEQCETKTEPSITKVEPSIQCEGEQCETKTESTVPKTETSIPCEGEQCETKTAPSIPEVELSVPCEGEQCKTQTESSVSQTEISVPCEGDQCETGTESSIPKVEPSVPCEGEQCETKTETTIPEIEPSVPCEGEQCKTETEPTALCEGEQCETKTEPSIPEVEPSVPCEGEQCQTKTEPSVSQTEISVPCEGDQCKTGTESSIPKVEPSVSCEGEQCETKTESAVPKIEPSVPCEGEQCKTETEPTALCEGEQCETKTEPNIPEVEPSVPCEGEQCKTQTEPSVSQTEISVPCEGDQCETGTESSIPKLEPSVPCEGEQCETKTESTVPKIEPSVPCEGEQCKTETEPTALCEGEQCETKTEPSIPEIEPSVPCEGEQCRTQTESSVTPTGTSVPCEGGQCETGTESSMPEGEPSAPCEGDQCETKTESTVPKAEPSVPCEGEQCQTKTVPTTSCAGEECDTKTEPTVPKVEPSVPCDGEKCDSKPESIIPKLCDNEDECKRIEVSETSKPLCEGDHCKEIPMAETGQPECQGESCATIAQESCVGNECVTGSSTTPSSSEKDISTECKGPECMQQTPVTPDEKTTTYEPFRTVEQITEPTPEEIKPGTDEQQETEKPVTTTESPKKLVPLDEESVTTIMPEEQTLSAEVSETPNSIISEQTTIKPLTSEDKEKVTELIPETEATESPKKTTAQYYEGTPVTNTTPQQEVGKPDLVTAPDEMDVMHKDELQTSPVETMTSVEPQTTAIDVTPETVSKQPGLAQETEQPLSESQPSEESVTSSEEASTTLPETLDQKITKPKVPETNTMQPEEFETPEISMTTELPIEETTKLSQIITETSSPTLSSLETKTKESQTESPTDYTTIPSKLSTDGLLPVQTTQLSEKQTTSVSEDLESDSESTKTPEIIQEVTEALTEPSTIRDEIPTESPTFPESPVEKEMTKSPLETETETQRTTKSGEITPKPSETDITEIQTEKSELSTIEDIADTPELSELPMKPTTVKPEPADTNVPETYEAKGDETQTESPTTEPEKIFTEGPHSLVTGAKEGTTEKATELPTTTSNPLKKEITTMKPEIEEATSTKEHEKATTVPEYITQSSLPDHISTVKDEYATKTSEASTLQEEVPTTEFAKETDKPEAEDEATHTPVLKEDETETTTMYETVTTTMSASSMSVPEQEYSEPTKQATQQIEITTQSTESHETEPQNLPTESSLPLERDEESVTKTPEIISTTQQISEITTDKPEKSESPQEENTATEPSTSLPEAQYDQQQTDLPVAVIQTEGGVTQEPKPSGDKLPSQTTESSVGLTTETVSSLPSVETSEIPQESVQTLEPKLEVSETTPYLVELEEHTHKVDEMMTTILPSEVLTTSKPEIDQQVTKEIQTEGPIKETGKPYDGQEGTSVPDVEPSVEVQTTPASQEEPYKPTESTADGIPTEPARIPDTMDNKYDTESNAGSTVLPDEEKTTLLIPIETESPEKVATSQPDKDTTTSLETVVPEKGPFQDVATTPKMEEDITKTPVSLTKPDEKPSEAEPSTPAQELPKPGVNELQPTDEIPSPEEEGQFPTGGYGQEPDYVEEDQTFGPGTCRYGGKVYVSAQQIPRDDPCDFCFCFRSDIICLQQSCPPPIHGCHEEPIQGFCCPRYECPVSMATTLNVTTTTTTTTTTLPPHFLPHAYKGAAQRKGCQIKGHTYKVGEVVRASSGPCLHCTCGGDGQMKCDPKACTPEPMLRQMIAAAVSAKRRR